MSIKITKKQHPSNKTQTLGKKPAPKPETPPPGHHHQGKLKPFIDKLSVIIDPPEKDAHAIHNSLWTNLEDGGVFQSAGQNALKGGWHRAQLIALPSSSYRPLLQYRWEKKGPTGKASRMRLDFNPRKLGEQGLIELDAVLTSLWHDGWAYVIEYGRITRIDIAVDVPGIRMDEVLFVPKQGASEIHWGRDGHLQSFRHGQPQGNQTVVYSVKQKRLSKKQPWSGPSTVRIERRLRNPSPWKLPELGMLKNPFVGVSFTMMPGPPPDEMAKAKQWMWSTFEDSVKARGLANALALVPTDRRTKYRAYLKEHPQPWWNPEAIWDNWSKAYLLLLTLSG